MWLESKVLGESFKRICGERVQFFEISLSRRGTFDTLAVERWQLRRSEMCEPIEGGLILKGTKVEVLLAVDIRGEPAFKAWAMASVREDSHNEDPLSVEFLNHEFWKPATFPRLDCRVATKNDITTQKAWSKAPCTPLICDMEPHINQKLASAISFIRGDLAPSLESLTPRAFEPFREELNELADVLITSRRYAKAITIIQLIQDVENAISRNRKKESPSHSPGHSIVS